MDILETNLTANDIIFSQWVAIFTNLLQNWRNSTVLNAESALNSNISTPRESTLSQPVTVFLLFVYYSLTLFAVSGNVLCVIVMQRGTLRSMSMSVYLSAMAVFDTLFFISRFVSGEVAFQKYTTLCKFFTFLTPLTMCGSVWMIVGVTVDRLIAVCFPFKAKYLCTRKRSLKIVACLTILLLGLNTPPMFFVRSINDTCTALDPHFKIQQGLVYSIIALYSWLPSILLAILNTCIAIALAVAEVKKKKTLSIKHAQSQSATRKATAMVFTVSLLHIVLSLPLSLYYAWKMLSTSSNDSLWGTNSGDNDQSTLQTIANALTYINYGINFILYVVAGKIFRAELRQLFREWRKRCAVSINGE